MGVKKQKNIDATADTNVRLGTYLIIVESPAKCKKIESFLGSQYTCIASKGHLRTISNLKDIKTKPHFKIEFSNIKGKEEHIEWMRNIISKYSPEHIYLGTDDDREGMAIAWHICMLFGLPIEQTPRIVFNEITKSALERAIQNTTRIDMNIVHAQNARQVLDMYVGFKISPYLWKFLFSNKSSSLSAGRCQTPALRLVYDNACEIDEYIKMGIQTKYKIGATFFGQNIQFDLTTELDKSPDVEQFMEESKTFSHILTLGTTKESVHQPPKPLNTSRLLQVASNTLSLSPKHTMDLCQILYQSGYITYMRTDSTCYSKEYLSKAKNYIVSSWGDEYVGDLENIENKNAVNPHEAIRVTQIENTEVNSDDIKLCSLYKLIWRNSIESCMSPCVMKCTPAIISAPQNKEYKHIIEIPKFNGWRSVKNITEKQAEGSGILLYLQSIAKSKSPATYNKIDATVKLSHQKPSHYTEASLIQKLEDLGIGRPSTFSSIIETIKERGYIEKQEVPGEKVSCIEYMLEGSTISKHDYIKIFGAEKNKLVIQPLGIETILFLTKHFNPLFSYEYTKNMELQLDQIALPQSNLIVWYSICKECSDQIKELSKNITIQKQIYDLEDGYELCFQKYGPVIRKKREEVDNENDIDIESDKYEYKSIKKNIHLDLEKLRKGEYKLDDLLETTQIHIGDYDGANIYLKSGKFGIYIEWGEKRISCKEIPEMTNILDINKISPDQVFQIVKNMNDIRHPNGKNVLRTIDNNMSIRKGKYGPYVFYQTPSMQKPAFYSMSKYKKGYMECDVSTFKQWVRDTHGVTIE
jgi:DNA topoisomerase-1